MYQSIDLISRDVDIWPLFTGHLGERPQSKRELIKKRGLESDYLEIRSINLEFR